MRKQGTMKRRASGHVRCQRRAWHALAGIGCAVVLLGLCFGSGAPLSADELGPGRIAVGGMFPTGYLGLLARHGLPREVLLDYQLADPSVLARYDLLIIAGLPPTALQATLPILERRAEAGGNILLEYGRVPALRPVGAAVALRPVERVAALNQVGVVARAPFRLVGDANPLRQDLGDTDTFLPPRMGFVPPIADPEHTVVLAEYVTPPRPTRPLAREDLRAGGLPFPSPPNQGPPAIILQQCGAGKMILCGPAIGQDMALAGLDYDGLILGMIRLLTDGRAVPQLQAESVRLGRRQSVRSLGLSSEEEQRAAAEATWERPAGPGQSGKPPKGYILLEEDPASEFNLTGQAPRGGGDLFLNYWNSRHFLRVWVTPKGVRVVRQVGEQSRCLAFVEGTLAPGTPFLIKERRDRLMVQAGNLLATANIAGLHRGSIAAPAAFGEVHYQPVEPPFFDDDFMRTSNEPGDWTTHGGTWKTASVQNPDLGANPFSYRVEAHEPAFALAGYPFWDDYRFCVAVRPETPRGFVGVGLYAQDPENLLLFRAGVRAGTAALPDGLALVRWVKGVPQVLAQGAGGLAPNQWYRLEVKAQGPWVGAFVDGVKVLTAKDFTFSGGQIALYAENTSARFDDVQVRPSTAPAQVGQPLVAHVPPYAGIIDVDSWAGPATPWEASPTLRGLFWRRGIFPGDVSLRFRVPPLPAGGEAMLLLDGDGESLRSGVALRLRRVGIAGYLDLLVQGQSVMAALVPLKPDVALTLRRDGSRVYGMVNDRPLLHATYAPRASGGRVAFRALGFRPSISDVALWSDHVRDYTFDTAPVDWWVGSGEWDVTNRWSCTPDWSWFCGYGSGVAAIWHKQPFVGDVVLDFYAGPKMIGLGEQRIERIADFNAVLCGDGEHVESGYSFVVAEDGWGARILRRGQVVAENREFRPLAQVHNRWVNVRVEKRGPRVQLLFEGQVLCSYNDPDPLPGGHVGIWTRNNGILLPRITLYYEGAGQIALR